MSEESKMVPPGDLANADAATPKSAAFDPGPWIYLRPRPYDGDDDALEGSFEDPGGIEAANGNPVCMFGDCRGSATMFENVANAHLIEAAPQMFYALRQALNRIERPHLAPDSSVVAEVIRAAIDAALGPVGASSASTTDANRAPGMNPDQLATHP